MTLLGSRMHLRSEVSVSLLKLQLQLGMLPRPTFPCCEACPVGVMLTGKRVGCARTWCGDIGVSLRAVVQSEYHYNRLFKRAVGLPPSQYHIKLQMIEARRLLRETELTVVTVSNKVGYTNPSHFSRIFRKDTGFSPSEYRRQR